MTQLHEILAVEKGARAAYTAAITSAYHRFQKQQPLSGIVRTYRPRDDEGEQLPEEKTRVQFTVRSVLNDLDEHLAHLFDTVASKDKTNQHARADVIVDGRTLLPQVPTSHLLFLEKQLADLATLIKSLPKLDPAETWSWDSNLEVYTSEPVETHRTKKVPRNHVKAPATDKHPAQVELYHEDQVVGYWRTIKHSGAEPESAVAGMLTRVRRLQDAVKQARERANTAEVDRVSGEGMKIMRYVLSGGLPGNESMSL